MRGDGGGIKGITIKYLQKKKWEMARREREDFFCQLKQLPGNTCNIY